MTTDPFTEAACAEGQARVAAMLEVAGASADIRAWFPAGFEKGAEWARTHLAAQEPTDAEVEAAAQALAHWDGASGWNTPAWDGEITETAYLHGARKALTAARAARRDEEKRDG